MGGSSNTAVQALATYYNAPGFVQNQIEKPAKQAASDARNAADDAQNRADAQIAQANQQKTNAINQTANNTAATQARVRALSNPNSSGSTLMTDPIGGTQQPSGNSSSLPQPPSSAGSLQPVTGKSSVGT